MSNLKSKTEKKILVIGSTGKTGRRVLQGLTNAGVSAVGVTHSTTPKFDWNQPATWETALHGCNTVYISYFPDIAVPGAVKHIEEFTKVALKQGVQKLVLLSGRGEEEAQACEKIVMKAGMDWTIIRSSWFCQNFSEGYLVEPILAGHVALPVGEIGEPFIDVDDIADVAVAALTEDRHNQKIYEVTGPRMLTFKEAIGEIANATGKPIQFEQIPMKDYTTMLGEYGLPPVLINLITYLFTEVLDGRNESLGDGVQQALGRKPIDFSEYVRKAVAQGAWGSIKLIL
jgi:uncharacterized protein YbjT (DUF2867 family)